jgi:glycosyltransferase involved in cell wall biosynthesis
MDRIVELSLIVPTYNRRILVENALRSALAQTYPVDEIIVIDDGSNDGTGAALRDLFGDRLRYTWQAHAGVSAARNHGLRLARGTYITFLDSDDSWLPNKIQEQMTWMKESSGLLHGALRLNSPQQTGPSRFNFSPPRLTPGEWRYFQMGVAGTIPCTVVRANAPSRFGGNWWVQRRVAHGGRFGLSPAHCGAL